MGNCKSKRNLNGSNAMAKKPGVNVNPTEKGWEVKLDHAKRASSTHKTKAEAVEAGRERAKELKTELTIRKEDGTIQNKNSYGNGNGPDRHRRELCRDRERARLRLLRPPGHLHGR